MVNCVFQNGFPLMRSSLRFASPAYIDQYKVSQKLFPLHEVHTGLQNDQSCLLGAYWRATEGLQHGHKNEPN